jgi:hypothetical protein
MGVMARMIILIGGMPTTGKTTLARELSQKLALPWLSTDQTRLIMQGVADPKQYPQLLSAHGLSAAEFFQRFSPEEIAEREYMHGIETWPGNKKLIEDDFTWREGFVLEGVNILPSLLPSLQTTSDVRSIFLTDEGDDALRQVIFSRGLYADADTYADELKEYEITWARLFDQRIQAEAQQYGYPVVRVQKDSEIDMPNVLSALGLPV